MTSSRLKPCGLMVSPGRVPSFIRLPQSIAEYKENAITVLIESKPNLLEFLEKPNRMLQNKGMKSGEL